MPVTMMALRTLMRRLLPPAEPADQRDELRGAAILDLHARPDARDAGQALIAGRADRDHHPAGARQLCLQDGVLIVDPARVVALVEILRRHILQLSTLRLSNHERAEKTLALYEFIRSDQCSKLFERIHGKTEDLIKLQDKEKKDHNTFWKRQDWLYRGIRNACADLRSEIDRIIESAD